MKTSKIEFSEYDEYVIDGENKSCSPFTLRGFSDKKGVVVRNCVFDVPFLGFSNPADLCLIEPPA